MKFSLAILLTSLAFATPSFAQQKADDHAGHHPTQATADAGASMTDAEVRKIDREAGKVTLRHGEIKNLAMPPMTMVFNVREAASLATLTPGDRIRFRAVLEGDSLTVTDIQASR